MGEPHTVTLTVDPFGEEELGEIIEGELIVFRVVEGPNMGRESVPFSGECVPDSCRLDQNLQVSWTYTSQETGLDTITAFFEDEELSDEALIDFVTKRWEPGTRPIPTLSEWGLIAMAGVMGVVGYLVLRKRKLAA